MKATELMIGDWVFYTTTKTPTHVKIGKIYVNKEASISEVNFYGNLGNDSISDICFEPIPLTSEILEKNGFLCYIHHEKFFCISGNKRLYTDCKELGIWTRNIAGDWEWFSIAECKYVHQLQHALRLCGIEKEIIL